MGEWVRASTALHGLEIGPQERQGRIERTGTASARGVHWTPRPSGSLPTALQAVYPFNKKPGAARFLCFVVLPIITL